MPETISLNLEIVELTAGKEEKILSSLLFPEIIRFKTKEEEFAKEFIQAVSKKYVKTGEYLDVIKLFPQFNLKEKILSVSFEKSKDRILFPEINLEFKVLYCKVDEKVYMGFVPVLGIESHGETEEILDKNLIENIKLEFARNKRLAAADMILTTLWYDHIKSYSRLVKIDFFSLSELEDLKTGEKKQYLPIVSELIRADTESETFGLNYEKKQLLKALQAKYMRSILLIGASGIGKTSLIYDVCSNKSLYGLSSGVFRETTATRLIQKLTEGDGWQQNLSKVCLELGKDNNILFFSNFADLFETGQYEGNNVSFAEYLRKYIERGEITIISECSEEEAAVIDLLSPGYLSLFHTIHFEDAASKDINDIIQKKIKFIAGKNNVTVTEDAVKEIIQLQMRYTPYSGFPGKTIRFLESVILNQKQNKSEIDKSLIIKYFCEETGLPDFMIDQLIPVDIDKIENFFQNNIFGQEAAVETIINLLTSVKTSLSRSGKPIASLLFAGPTGVGKTEMAKVLAQFMFGSRQKMFRFDMSEYSDPESVLRLTGSGFYTEGILTSKIRQEPFSVVLFDELEKAHYSFFDLLLQILGEGRLTDSKGKITDFCSTIIIMTSNIGAKSYQKPSFGFVQNQDIKEEAKKHFIKEVQNSFRPELFNRLDQVIPFLPLDITTVRNIVQREIDQISKREGIRYRKTTFKISETALDYLCNKGYDVYYGARQLQRTLSEELLVPLSKKLNKYKFDIPLTINIDILNNELNIHVKAVSTEQIPPVSMNNEKVLNLRRECQKIEEGEYFVKLLSELDILEHRKRKLKNDFWKNAVDSERYSTFIKLREKFSDIFKTIKELERENFLQQSGFQSGITDISESIGKWEKDYTNLKIELFQALTSGSEKCTIGMYGSSEYLPELFNIYKNIGEKKGYKINMKSVWLRSDQILFTVDQIVNRLSGSEGLLIILFGGKLKSIFDDNREIKLKTLLNKTFTDKKLFEEELKKLKISKEDRDYIIEYAGLQYFKYDKLTPENENDRLLGLEIEFTGQAPYLYFSPEGYVEQSFKKNIKDQESILYYVRVLDTCLENFDIPEGIHRKSFYKDLKATRIYAPGYFKDSKNKIEKNSSNYQKIIKEILDSHFIKNLTDILVK